MLKAETLSKRRAFEEAARYAAAFFAWVEKRPNKRSVKASLRVQGIIELDKGDLAKAIDLLARAKSLLWFETWHTVIPRTREFHAFYMEPLALAYFRSGDLERARQEYEAITRLTTGRLAYGDIYARSFYQLGRIYEQMGKTRQARANYRKFLDLWKDADPGLPEVEDAKKRLAALDAR
jgi:tetratricopeptide (TPR) repeat protein